VPFVFDNAVIVPEKVGSSGDARELAARMSEAWIAFARTGNPNTKNLPNWSPYLLPRRSTMVFDKVSKLIDDPRAGERKLFEQVPYVQPGT